jgi:hypothetical protein
MVASISGKTTIVCLAALLTLLVVACHNTPPSDQAKSAAVTDAVGTATDAYIYGYPLVTMEMTRRISTNVEKPEGTRAPMGQFANLRSYLTAAFRDVTAPNADTLYSLAWLDLSNEPAGGLARQGEGSELAACAKGQIHPYAAVVLAEGDAAIDP